MIWPKIENTELRKQWHDRDRIKKNADMTGVRTVKILILTGIRTVKILTLTYRIY